MSDDDDEENAAAIEVELLLGMYTDNECEIIQDEGTTTFCLHLVPHSAGGHLSSFCKLSLKLILNNKSYPDEPPIISFQTARGLAEAKQQELLTLLRNECEELAGDYVCSSLATIATDYLTENNKPPRCAICLDAINSKNTKDFITTACFHFFHAKCLTSWWTRCALSAATSIRHVNQADVSWERENLNKFAVFL